MKTDIFFHFSVAGFSNCYLVGAEPGSGAIIIDPGTIGVELIRSIENNGYHLESVLLTHSHPSHVKGLNTLMKIYDAKIYAFLPETSGFPCEKVEDGEPFEAIGHEVTPLAIAGHSSDSVVYLMDRFIFTGDVLGAGRVGTAPNAFARALLVEAIKNRICALPDDYLIFPGHGAPSTLEVERRFNPLL